MFLQPSRGGSLGFVTEYPLPAAAITQFHSHMPSFRYLLQRWQPPGTKTPRTRMTAPQGSGRCLGDLGRSIFGSSEQTPHGQGDQGEPSGRGTTWPGLEELVAVAG